MKKIQTVAWATEKAQRIMHNVDDTFRGFVKSPDGGVELEVELSFSSEELLGIDICVATPEKDLTQE